MAFLSEAAVEQALLEQFRALGYGVESEENIGPDGHRPERLSHDKVILQKRFADTVARLNPGMPLAARQDACRRVTQTELPNMLEENRRLHQLMTEGVDVEYYADDGVLTAAKVALIDFERPERNDWLAVNQFVVIAGQGQQVYKRRPDVVVFVNGLPLAVLELKAPGDDGATLLGAFNQLQTYKSQIPALFHTNALLLTSDGITARLGSLSADLERFMPWRTTDGGVVAVKGLPELATLVEGVFEQGRLLLLLRDFTVFGETGLGLAKIVAGYHQFHAVIKAVESTIRASTQWDGASEDPADWGLPSVRTQAKGDKRAGVIWHTQGSGKSLLMAFYAGQLVKHPAMANPTLVVLTDRNDLDDQLFATFSMCRDLIRQTPVQADSREDLQRLLARASGGVIFTTLQKFGEANQALTQRRNVVVIADEAHRSQYGFRAKLDAKTGEVSYGFAKHLRDALPNASFIGFTGTLIEADDVNTPAVFGNYIDIYDISRAVEDGATVPIYYESRLVAEDLVRHLEDRVAALDGKAMVVCMSRRICVKLYDEITRLRPHWHSADDSAGVLKVVMTGAASDPMEWQQHIGNKVRRDLLAKRARDAADPLKLVLVRDMWLTGFDAPCMHTMYVDKPMQGHGLMQAIARVNRVFRDKPAGLIVDYIGVAQNLKSALGQYSARDQQQTGVDESQAVAVLMEKYEIVQSMYHGFDYASAMAGTPQQRLAMMAGAIEWILNLQQQLAAKEKTKGGQEGRASPLPGRRAGAVQGVRPGVGQRRGAQHP